jgi:hypothetical protein
VVVAGAKPAGGSTEIGRHRDAIEHPELSQVEGGILLVGPDDPYQVIEDLGDSDRSEVGVTLL